MDWRKLRYTSGRTCLCSYRGLNLSNAIVTAWTNFLGNVLWLLQWSCGGACYDGISRFTVVMYILVEPGVHNTYGVCRYNDSPRAGRSGERIPVGAWSSTPVQTGPGAQPAFYTKGTGSFLGVKRPERDVDHPLPSSAEVKERVEVYLYTPILCLYRVKCSLFAQSSWECLRSSKLNCCKVRVLHTGYVL